MIAIKNDPGTKYCNACFDGLAVVDVTYQKRGGNFSSSFSLCRDCLAELANVATQANTASTRLGGTVAKNSNGEQPPSG